MAFTAKDVMALREKTGAGVMDCKKALTDADGDMNKAADLLRERGIAKAEKKASRIAAEGIVACYVDGKTGVLIDANVNDLLIRNLFYDKAPLHDGAVVISGDKITAAGCFLPLTQRAGLDSNLGTRHRAAIGMAERSDAVVIVVSEETGGISLAYDFNFIRNIDLDELKAFLQEQVLRVNIEETEA